MLIGLLTAFGAAVALMALMLGFGLIIATFARGFGSPPDHQ